MTKDEGRPLTSLAKTMAMFIFFVPRPPSFVLSRINTEVLP
jgi:hypothetical protein